MFNNSAIIRELRIIGECWNIPLLYEAANALEYLCNLYSQVNTMYTYQERKAMELERENIALKVKIDQLWRENQAMKRQSVLMIGGRIK